MDLLAHPRVRAALRARTLLQGRVPAQAAGREPTRQARALQVVTLVEQGSIRRLQAARLRLFAQIAPRVHFQLPLGPVFRLHAAIVSLARTRPLGRVPAQAAALATIRLVRAQAPATAVLQESTQ
jgi:hypothetical protein